MYAHDYAAQSITRAKSAAACKWFPSVSRHTVKCKKSVGVQESVTVPLGNGVLQVVHASGNSYDLGNSGAQQGDDHNDHDKVLNHSAACELVHDLKVLSGPLLMPTFPCPSSYLHAGIEVALA